MNKNTMIGVAIFLILIVLGFMMWNKGSKNTSQEQQVIDNTSGTMLVGSNAINVNEQKIGSSVIASFVVLEKQGYVVIHELTEGKPGKIIGVSALLPKGQSKDISITLSTALIDGASYLAMLHLDNDDSVFDDLSDMPAKNNNEVVMMEFQASADAKTQTNDEISL